MRLYLSQVITVHVSTCTSYDFSCAEVVTLIRRVCFYVSSLKWVIGFYWLREDERSKMPDSPPWQNSNSQGPFCQAVYGPKIDYWNGTPTILPWFGTEWLLFPKIKSALKRTRFQDIEDIQKKWRRYWTLFHNRSSKNFSNSGSIVELSEKLLKWTTSKGILVSKIIPATS
jgi:hypothetical protein